MKEKEVSIQFRMRQSTHEKLKVVAEKELRSLNGQIEYFSIKGIEEFEKNYGEIKIEKKSATETVEPLSEAPADEETVTEATDGTEEIE